MQSQSMEKFIEAAKISLDEIEKNELKLFDINITPQQFTDLSNSCNQRLASDSVYERFFGENFDEKKFFDDLSNQMQILMNSLVVAINSSGVNMKSNRSLSECSKTLNDILQALGADFNKLTIQSKKHFWKKNKEQKQDIKANLTAMVEFKKRIHLRLKNEAKVIASIIASNFEKIYMFYGCAIKSAKKHNDELALVEISSHLDKIIGFLSPLFSKSLDVKELVYYYMLYEFKNLRADAIGLELS